MRAGEREGENGREENENENGRMGEK